VSESDFTPKPKSESSPSKPEPARKLRSGPKPLPPRPDGVDPLSGPLKLDEAAGVMRKAPQTVRRLADRGELTWVGDLIWGPSIRAYWARNLVTGKRSPTPPVKRKRGRPHKIVPEAAS
jgi:hypothetical protein